MTMLNSILCRLSNLAFSITTSFAYHRPSEKTFSQYGDPSPRMCFVNFLYSVPYIVSCFDRITVLCNLACAFQRSRCANSSTRSYCAEQMKPLLHDLPKFFVFFVCLFCCHFFLPLKRWRLAAKSSLAVQPFCVVGYIS